MQNVKTVTKKPIKNAALKLALLSFIFYAVSYVCRKSFDSNINEIMDFFGQGKASVGLIGTMFFIAYAVGQVVHGILCKVYRPKSIMFIAGMVVSVLSLSLGLIPVGNFGIIKYLWFINGFANAAFWPVIIFTLNQCTAEKHKPTVVLLACFPVSVGTFMSYASSSLFSFLHKFRYSFVFAAVAMAAISIYWLVRSGPLMDACLAEKAELDGEVNDRLNTHGDNAKSGKWSHQLTVLFVCSVVFAVINNLVRDALNTWTPTILKDMYGIENWLSVLLSVLVPLMSVFGGIISIAMYRKCKDYMILYGGLYLAAGIILIIMVLLLGLNSWIISLLCLVLAALSMTTINNLLTSIFPLNVEKGVNAGTIAGLIDGFCYVGSAISAYGMGSIAEKKGGWNFVLILLICACLFCTVEAIVVLAVKRGKKHTT